MANDTHLHGWGNEVAVTHCGTKKGCSHFCIHGTYDFVHDVYIVYRNQCVLLLLLVCCAMTCTIADVVCNVWEKIYVPLVVQPGQSCPNFPNCQSDLGGWVGTEMYCQKDLDKGVIARRRLNQGKLCVVCRWCVMLIWNYFVSSEWFLCLDKWSC